MGSIHGHDGPLQGAYQTGEDHALSRIAFGIAES